MLEKHLSACTHQRNILFQRQVHAMPTCWARCRPFNKRSIFRRGQGRDQIQLQSQDGHEQRKIVRPHDCDSSAAQSAVAESAPRDIRGKNPPLLHMRRKRHDIYLDRSYALAVIEEERVQKAQPQ